MKTQTSYALILLQALVLVALTAVPGDPPAGAEPAVSAADIAGQQTWGAADNVVGVKHLYLSAQPDQATFETALDHGVGVVINLRGPGEQDWDEAAAAAESGLTYYNLPVSRSGPGFDDDVLAEISRVVGKHRDTKILMHCSTGNRAAAWFAYHLVRDHGMPAEPSIELAKQAGLTHAGMESRVRAYLAPGTADGNEQ